MHLGSDLNELELTYQDQRYRITIHEGESALLERDAEPDCTQLELQVNPALQQIVAFTLFTAGQASELQVVAPAPEVKDLSEE